MFFEKKQKNQKKNQADSWIYQQTQAFLIRHAFIVGSPTMKDGMRSPKSSKKVGEIFFKIGGI